MGQNQSSRSIPTTPKGPPARPSTQPSARPLSQLGPQGPSYVNPENKVLPIVLPPSAKSLLRPVSQELSDFHPEYKEIFRSESLEDDNGNITNGEVVHDGSKHGSNSQDVNGNLSPRSNGHISNDNRNGDLNRRPVSMYTNGGGGGNNNTNVKGHRRQLSASSVLYSKENTIIEHPDEPKYNDDRPRKVTLPAKSSFDMPYSENLTYAQLAEYRRNQTLAELERKTGRKIEDLSTYAEDKQSNFERAPSTRSAKSYHSAGSAVSKKKSRAPPPPNQPPNPPGSKSAPNTPRGPPGSKSAPSTPRGSNMHTPPARPNKPPPILKSYSVDREPPADYDDAQPRKNVSINRSSSSASGSRKSYAPATSPPPPNAPPPPPPPGTGILRNTNKRLNKSMVELPRANSTSDFIKVRSPPVRQDSFNKPAIQTEQNKFLSQIQKAAENRAMRRQNSEPVMTSTPPINGDIDNKVEENLIINATTNTLESAKNDNDQDLPVKTPPPVALKPNRSSSSSFERQNSVTSESSTANSVQSSSSSVDQNGAVRRLNSLLQHDIKLAAQSKATKIVKHATPVKEKPKDPAQAFREQLAKAAYEREHRAKTGPTIDEKLKAAQAEEKEKSEANIVFYTDQVTVKRSDSIRKQNEEFRKEDTKKKEAIVQEVTLPHSEKTTYVKVESPKEVFTISKDKIEKPNLPSLTNGNMVEQKGEIIHHPRQMTPGFGIGSQKDSYRNSIYASKDWTPEVDLDSDDNISDTEVLTSSLGRSNGFKSSVFPAKVNEINYKGKKQKGKERKFKKSMENDEKKKHGSIKKFKNSVHKSVLNAFGSISKASGKVLKKNKSEDLDYVNDAPMNWTLSSSSSTPSFSGTPVASRPNLSDGQLSNRAYKYMVPNGYQDHVSLSSESSDEERIVSNKVMFESNGHIESNEDTDNEDDKDQKYLKRAGVAYVSKSGQIVVLPEYDKVHPGEQGPGEFDNHAPKLKNKKKKFTFDNTVRRKEREQISEKITMDATEKERKREEERRREMEADIDIKRTRELEARERLQRLEMQAQLHQQLLQQQQQYGMLSAPPLPPPNGFQQGFNPVEFSQFFAQQSGYGLPYGTQTGFGAPMYNNNVPNMSYDLSEYMRMMGVQNSTPTSTPQQLNAYMLHGGLNWPQTSLLSYPNKQQDDSKRNQVYQNWTGPKKQIVKSNSQGDSGASTSKKTSFYSADESDSSAGLSPQRTDASISASKNNINGDTNDNYGYKSKISVTTVYTPGFTKSAASDTGSVISDNSADR
ncbi:unnamed protein product [Mytilus coruscus]|uniref:Uncharacterized protein n=1 Tax=Mytilus coruscus TaxID=42192 RepID=A0A6J7ZTM9_MYTCO|nr:unnamed protein product [Mytilus coruscus]